MRGVHNIVLFIRYYYGARIVEDEVKEKEQKCMQKFSKKTMEAGDYINGRILQFILEQ
jgi:hypothetical protein